MSQCASYHKIASPLVTPLLSLLLLISSTFFYSLNVSANESAEKTKIAIVSSYHREYVWSQETSQGIMNALLDNQYLTSQEHAREFLKNDFIETKDVIIKKWWMDTKRKNKVKDIRRSALKVINELEQYRPTIILTGDDHATNYIGNAYIDSPTPLVFWGINANPMKYNLLDSLEKPGHNVTGVYQSDPLIDNVIFLSKLLPKVKTIAIFSDDSVTGRVKAKRMKQLSKNGLLPIKVIDIVTTNKITTWKVQAIDLAEKVDAFFILNYDTLKNDDGQVVEPQSISEWYLDNIKKPEMAYGRRFVQKGLLAADNNSGVEHAYKAFMMAHDILQGANPANMPITTTKSPGYAVNINRAKALGIYDSIKHSPAVTLWYETSSSQKKN